MSDKRLVKYEVSSSIRTRTHWFFADDEYAMTTWIQEQEEAVDRFNSNPGAAVLRSGTHTYRRLDELKDLTLDDLPEIPLWILAKVLAFISV